MINENNYPLDFSSEEFNAALEQFISEPLPIIIGVNDPETIEKEQQCLRDVFAVAHELHMDFGGLQQLLDKKTEGEKFLSENELARIGEGREITVNGDFTLEDRHLASRIAEASLLAHTHHNLLGADEKHIETNGTFPTKKEAQLAIMADKHLLEDSQRRVLAEVVDKLCIGEGIDLNDPALQLDMVEQQSQTEAEQYRDEVEHNVRHLVRSILVREYEMSGLPQHDDLPKVWASQATALQHLITNDMRTYEGFSEMARRHAIKIGLSTVQYDTFMAGVVHNIKTIFNTDNEDEQ